MTVDELIEKLSEMPGYHTVVIDCVSEWSTTTTDLIGVEQGSAVVRLVAR